MCDDPKIVCVCYCIVYYFYMDGARFPNYWTLEIQNLNLAICLEN